MPDFPIIIQSQLASVKYDSSRCISSESRLSQACALLVSHTDYVRADSILAEVRKIGSGCHVEERGSDFE